MQLATQIRQACFALPLTLPEVMPKYVMALDLWNTTAHKCDAFHPHLIESMVP
jgi:hypothetical protein